MAPNGHSATPHKLESDVQDMKIEDEIRVASIHHVAPAQTSRHTSTSEREEQPPLSRKPLKYAESPRNPSSSTQSPAPRTQKEEVVGGDILVKMEPGDAPKLTRKQSQKVPARPKQLFTHLEDATSDATKSFEVLRDCHYAAKYMGYTEPPLECDCSEEWGKLPLPAGSLLSFF